MRMLYPYDDGTIVFQSCPGVANAQGGMDTRECLVNGPHGTNNEPW